MSETFPTAAEILAQYSDYQVEITPERKAECLKAADAWGSMDGIDKASGATDTASAKRAVTHRRTAHSLRIEAETGIAVCACHFRPPAMMREEDAKQHNSRGFRRW